MDVEKKTNDNSAGFAILLVHMLRSLMFIVMATSMNVRRIIICNKQWHPLTHEINKMYDK
jgi:hypothetical protein